MREYSKYIQLIKNRRGVYCIDTSIGCSAGTKEDKTGCYGDCYAARSARAYGYDFSKTVLRGFKNEAHKRKVVLEISRANMSFVRIGCSGDPSENWGHCFEILKTITKGNKEIVIITKHWNNLKDEQLIYCNTKNITFNTSVSALDNPERLNNSLIQYKRIGNYCKSILRVVSCDFNLENPIGAKLSALQNTLFQYPYVIDTVFRPSKKNTFIIDGVINAKTGVFNGHKSLMSKFNKKTFIGKCQNCVEACGANMAHENKYNRPGVVNQLYIL